MNKDLYFKFGESSKGNGVLLWFWRNYIRSSLPLLIFALFFMTIEGSMVGLLSYSVKILFDNVFLAETGGNILKVGLLIFAIFSVRALSGFAQRTLVSLVSQKMLRKLQLDIVDHMLTLDTKFFYKNSPGLLIERVRGDSQKIVEMLGLVMMTIGRDGTALISLLVVSILMDWRWSLIAFIGVPVLIVPILYLQAWIRLVAGKARNIDAENTTHLDEIFHGINAIKLYGTEKNEITKLQEILVLAKKTKFKMEVAMAGMPAIIDIVAAFGFLAVMIFGSSDIISGEKTVGEFMSFFTAMALIFEPLRRLSNVSGSTQVAVASVEKLHLIVCQKPKIKNPVKFKRSTNLPKNINIIFENVSFSYGENKILSDINFSCGQGDLVALVGPSGAGKTTILNLIPRLLDPLEGKILINNMNLRNFKISDLRNLISFVSQENSLFDDTIRANIVMDKAIESDKDLETVLIDSFVSDFLEKLPQRLDTRVGPRGINLSGGQRQRILIARAFFRNAPILLLDEPTSALDSRSEIFIQKALKKLSVGRTTILSAHRLSTIKDANKILVLNSGNVVEHGTHRELLINGRYYPELIKSQMLKVNKKF